MIGKITRRKNFHRLVNYLLKPDKKAEILYSKNLDISPKYNISYIAEQFCIIAELNDRVTTPIKHFSIGFDPKDKEVDQDLKIKVAKELMEELGYKEESQYLVVAHQREEPNKSKKRYHDHIHILANSVKTNGKWINDAYDYSRVEKTLRKLEKKYQLTPFQRNHRSNKQSYHNKKHQGKEETKELIKREIEAGIKISNNIHDLIKYLNQQNIKVEIPKTRTGKTKGIIYHTKTKENEDYQISGSKLGDYTINKILEKIVPKAETNNQVNIQPKAPRRRR